jgi:hypothetical protein
LYQRAAEKRLRGLFSDLMNFWEPQVRRGELDRMEDIDFQASIQNLREWYAFMRAPQNKRFSANEALGHIPGYIARIEAVRNAVKAHCQDPFALAAAHGMPMLSSLLVQSIFESTLPEKRAPWV